MKEILHPPTCGSLICQKKSFTRRSIKMTSKHMLFITDERQGITEHVKVCRKAFLGVLNEVIVSKDCVKNTFNLVSLHLKLVEEAAKGKNTVRQYLSSQLNVKKMWETYLEKHMVEIE
ncbi:hypothetical protein PR048_008107 [Dryococelus australis]|uniref:Uncharacterized protein n=1 Tax=Dryococelus australis TaxID=614101 RepID=A0ABQ9HW56_9NEOP|nr:hypothetical protein PR048_008107 [Dryococelus australis]